MLSETLFYAACKTNGTVPLVNLSNCTFVQQMIGLTTKKKISFFLSSEFFTDAFRTTVSILLPVWILFSLGKPDVAIAVGVGALLTSLTDSSGTYADKKVASLLSLGLFFFVALVTSFSWPYPWLMGIILFIFCFSLSMLTALGNRFSMIGITAAALSIFISGLRPHNGFEFSAYILAGGTCYYLISLLQAWLWPFRSLQQAVSSCVKATAMYMRERKDFYNPNIPLEDCYHKTIPLHTLVNERHENVRDLLLRDKMAMQPGNQKGQLLLKIATQVIDLYEHITTVHFDYQHFRQAFRMSGALEIVSRLIEIMATDIEDAGDAFLLRQSPVTGQHEEEIAYLNGRLQYILSKETGSERSLLLQLQQNMDDIARRIAQLKAMLSGQEEIHLADQEVISYQDFLTYRPQTISQFKTFLNFRSPIFRFSLRLAVACTFAFVLAQVLPLGPYSYWIMLTVIVIMKPAFSITRQRNKQRLVGTLLGVVAGLLLIAFIKNTTVLLVLSLIFLLGFFTYNRSRYTLGVLFITPMVIICLHIYSEGKTAFIFERVYDTLIGCGIALAASYLFPVWEKYNLSRYIRNVLDANYAYLEAFYQKLSGQQITFSTYKLLRKNVYTHLADFSSAFQRLLLEPHQSELAVESLQRFQALNHQLYGTVASLSLKELNARVNDAQLTIAAHALNSLRNCFDSINTPTSFGEVTDNTANMPEVATHSDEALTWQLNDLLKTTVQLQQLCHQIAPH